MFEHFAHYLAQHISGITRQEIEMMEHVAIRKSLARKEFLFKENEIFRYKIFVVKGLLKNSIFSEDGNEHIIKFTAEDGWTTDAESYNFGKPAECNVIAIEATEVLLFEHDAYESLRTAIPALNNFSERMLLHRITNSQKRILTHISSSAEDKYTSFINKYPQIHQRVPLHMVASYLGVSRETLTRIRHAQLITEKK